MSRMTRACPRRRHLGLRRGGSRTAPTTTVFSVIPVQTGIQGRRNGLPFSRERRMNVMPVTTRSKTSSPSRGKIEMGVNRMEDILSVCPHPRIKYWAGSNLPPQAREPRRGGSRTAPATTAFSVIPVQTGIQGGGVSWTPVFTGATESPTLPPPPR